MNRFYRSSRDKKVAGVCAGLGEANNLDPNLIRVLTVLVALFTAVMPVVAIYLVAWALLPEEYDAPINSSTPDEPVEEIK